MDGPRIETRFWGCYLLLSRTLHRPKEVSKTDPKKTAQYYKTTKY